MSEQGDASAEGAKFALQRIYVKDILNSQHQLFDDFQSYSGILNILCVFETFIMGNHKLT